MIIDLALSNVSCSLVNFFCLIFSSCLSLWQAISQDSEYNDVRPVENLQNIQFAAMILLAMSSIFYVFVGYFFFPLSCPISVAVSWANHPLSQTRSSPSMRPSSPIPCPFRSRSDPIQRPRFPLSCASHASLQRPLSLPNNTRPCLSLLVVVARCRSIHVVGVVVSAVVQARQKMGQK